MFPRIRASDYFALNSHEPPELFRTHRFERAGRIVNSDTPWNVERLPCSSLCRRHDVAAAAGRDIPACGRDVTARPAAIRDAVSTAHLLLALPVAAGQSDQLLHSRECQRYRADPSASGSGKCTFYQCSFAKSRVKSLLLEHFVQRNCVSEKECSSVCFEFDATVY